MAFDAILKKYFLVVVLGLMALSAYFEAAGATQLLGAALLAPASSSNVGVPMTTPYVVPPREPRTAEPIIDRNPFDSVTGSLKPKPEDELAAANKPPEIPQVVDPLGAAPCEGVTAFIITESTDRLWSVAALQGPGEPHPRMRRVGDDVAGKQVAYIGFNPRENSPSAWLEGGGQVCQALLFRTAPPPAAPTAAAAPPPAPVSAEATPRNAVPADIASKIKKISDTEFKIDRGVVDKILENQAELMRSARIVPEQKDGKVVGVRLFGVRPDTLLGTLGLQNGDRLESINGFNMASPEKALEAYARLRTAPSLDVSVNRRGSPLGIHYQIQ